MDAKIKEFEKRAIDAVSELRDLLGAKRIDVSVHVDNYEKGCKTDVTFFTSIGGGCVPTCSRMWPGL